MEEVEKDGDTESVYINVEDQNEAYENFSTTEHTSDFKAASARGQLCSGYPASVCLGLLCVLLLAVIVGLAISYNAKRDQLQVAVQNLTIERDGLHSKICNAEGLCPSGWRKFMSSCYTLIFMKTWDQSRQDCRDKEADLVIINSREEQEFVSGLAKNFWIGLTDRDEEGQWRWVDGTVFETGYWMTGEPNNGNHSMSLDKRYTEDCAQISYISKYSSSNWKDVYCNFRDIGICEKKMSQCQK